VVGALGWAVTFSVIVADGIRRSQQDPDHHHAGLVCAPPRRCGDEVRAAKNRFRKKEEPGGHNLSGIRP
jgi:hypothetical protein